MASVTAQATPNPQAYKFTLTGHTFDAPITLGDSASAAGTPFERIFQIDGVVSVFATSNFVTVTKHPGQNWSGLVATITELLEAAF